MEASARRRAAGGSEPEAGAPTQPTARRGWTVVAGGLVALAVLMRLNNAVRFPSLHGYDSFGHLTYIWYLLKAGRVPLADQGWSFFHPPLYHALAAAMWAPLQALDPKQVLKLINVVFNLVWLGSAWISYLIARRYFVENRLAQWLAPLLVLFLPVGLYTAPMLGNEGLNAVLCSLAVYVLLQTLRRPGWRNATVLGLVLGLALLTKATAAAVAAAAVLTLMLWALRTRQWRTGAASLALALAAATAVCGWHYGRNLARFGTPFPMSREHFVVAHVEDAFPRGQRGLLAYLRFDPHIFIEPRYIDPPVINSVWTGVFAGTWFEVAGGTLTPSVLTDPGARLAGRLLLVLGVVPTLIVLLGLGVALWRVVRRGWDDTLVVMLITFVSMIAMFVVYTRRVSTFTAVKPSYLLPVIVPFSVWFALGFDALGRWRRVMQAALAECALLLAVIVPVFSYPVLFAAQVGAYYFNALGVLYYFAGRPDSAREIFAGVANGYRLYTGHENLAAVALEEGKPTEALHELELAAQLLPDQAFAVGADRSHLVQLDLGEYECTRAYIEQLRGQDEAAVAAARRATELAPDIPEAHYNLAALLLRRGGVDEALEESRTAVQLDPIFTEAQLLLGIVESRHGDCGPAMSHLRQAASVRRPQRAYPWQTGLGDVLDAGMARRRIIDLCAAGLDPYGAARACRVEAAGKDLLIPWLPASRCAAVSGNTDDSQKGG